MSSTPLPFGGELGRKALHLLALVLPAAVLVVGKPDVLWGLAPLAALALTLDLLRVRSAALHAFIDGLFGWMMRPAERPDVGAPAYVNGATWTLLSMTLLTILFSVDIAVSAFVLFMIGDAAAALVGRRFGRRTWPAGDSNRTVEGTLGFVAAASAAAVVLQVTSLVDLPVWGFGVLVLVSAVLEAAPSRVNDNIMAPLGAAVVLHAIL